MCNLYSVTSAVQAMIDLTKALRNLTGNLPPQPGVFPDYPAPIVRNAPDGVRELTMARWGMPSSQTAQLEAAKKRAAKLEAKGKPVDFKELLRMEPDIGTTNIRNTASRHWQRWLGVENRCVVPFNSFSENEVMPDGSRPPVWFAFSDERPLAFFALDELDLCSQGKRRRDNERHLRLPDLRSERRGQGDPSESYAGHSDDGGRD